MKDNANDTTNDTTRSPFMVPGRADPKSAIDTHPDPTITRDAESVPQGRLNHNPFVWVVPSEDAVTGAESNPTTHGTEADPQSHDHGDPQSHVIPRPHNNDALDRTGQPRRTNPEQSHPNPKTTTEGQSGPRASKVNPTSSYVRLLDDRDDEDDDRTSVNGHSEEWQPIEDGTPWPGGTGDDDGGHVTGDDDNPFVLNGVLRVDETGGRDDATLGDPQSRVSTGVLGGTGIIDQGQLREGVQIGTVKRELIEYRPRSKRRAPRQKKHYPFSPQIPKVLDFLTRWRIGTTVQLARVAGWRDPNKNRILKKLRSYDEVGFMRETDLYAGPKIWTATEHGAELGFHSWLGGSKPSEINPMSQSHSFGLSSIASWLLCPWDDTPNVLGLTPDEWSQVRGEIKDGTAYVLSEKEYRSAYSAIRTTGRGLLPPEYRHGFIGGPGVGHETPVTGAWREWARRFKTGDATLDDSPELLSCDPEFMGANMWMWIIWGNAVWNPKVLETRAGQEVDLDDLSWSGRDGEARLRAEFRQYGFVDIEERLDIATNKPLLNKALGDQFALWDHLPDLIIARRRTDDGIPQSIAIELELSAKSILDYSRTMAAYGSLLGQTLYRKVIWLVPSKTIADKIRAGASQVGMILGEDYDIVPFVTSNEASVIKRSFYSGSDILPGRWTKRGLIEPCEAGGRSIPLA